jgi:hypothetical protein
VTRGATDGLVALEVGIRAFLYHVTGMLQRPRPGCRIELPVIADHALLGIVGRVRTPRTNTEGEPCSKRGCC